MIHVLASVSLKSGKRQDFLEIFNANVPNVLAEEGCIEYRPTIDVETGLEPQVIDENMVTVIEKWDSVDHLRAHLAAPHMLEYREKVADLVSGVSLKVLEDG